MLVLTRKTQQQIQIGNNIVVTILHVKGQAVRVGIEAPSDVRVVRGEIADKPAKASSVGPAATAPMAQHAAARATIGTPATSDFSSPQQPQPMVGESAGLFPYLRRRAGRSFEQASLSAKSSLSSSRLRVMSACH